MTSESNYSFNSINVSTFLWYITLVVVWQPHWNITQWNVLLIALLQFLPVRGENVGTTSPVTRRWTSTQPVWSIWFYRLWKQSFVNLNIPPPHPHHWWTNSVHLIPLHPTPCGLLSLPRVGQSTSRRRSSLCWRYTLLFTAWIVFPYWTLSQPSLCMTDLTLEDIQFVKPKYEGNEKTKHSSTTTCHIISCRVHIVTWSNSSVCVLFGVCLFVRLIWMQTASMHRLAFL